jgi:uncharacterized protein YceK
MMPHHAHTSSIRRYHGLCGAIVVMLACMVLSGCGTMGTFLDVNDEGTRYGLAYGGVRLDCRWILGDEYLQHAPPLKVIFVLDLPLSLVMDTALLPATLTMDYERAQRFDERLLGRWKADEDMRQRDYERWHQLLTIAAEPRTSRTYPAWWYESFPYKWLRERRPGTDYSLRPDREPTLVFTKKTVCVEMEELKTCFRYRTVRQDEHSVTILDRSGHELEKVTFDQSGFRYRSWALGGADLHYRKQEPPGE